MEADYPERNYVYNKGGDTEMMGIYCIENKVNHMKYIGQSINIRKRWAEHKRDLRKSKHTNDHLQKAWDKYGDNAFIFSILEICDRSLLNEREIYWVNAYDSMSKSLGYNIATPGDAPMKSRNHSVLSKRKMSESRKGNCSGENNGFYGNKHSKETLDKISKSLKGRFVGEKNPMYGKVSPMNGKKMSSESRKKMSDHHADFKGDKHPKARLSESDVKQIISLILESISSKEIASIYGVSKSCIDHIIGHKNWTYLTDGINFKNTKHRLAETTISQSERIKV